jgi:hypothetical protein
MNKGEQSKITIDDMRWELHRPHIDTQSDLSDDTCSDSLHGAQSHLSDGVRKYLNGARSDSLHSAQSHSSGSAQSYSSDAVRKYLNGGIRAHSGAATARNRARFGRVPLAAVLAVIVFVAGLLSGCNIDHLIGSITQTLPTAENTITALQDVSDEIEKALENGKSEITMNLVATEEEISNITTNMDPFWGTPTQYSIQGKFDDIELSGTPTDVVRVKFDLKPSINYYVYSYMKDSSFELPDDRTDVDAVARALPGIIREIYGDAANGGDISAYEKALAAHDWLVANLTYDPSIDQAGIENGVYGALIDRKTMCQGYAEALQLILLSATDVPVKMQIGDGNNGNGRWMGHAWNLIYMDDHWYQVDTTFDDPVGNPEGKVSHFYFGQNDAAMQNDHKWDSSYWPAADGADFLYYRKAGLYAESLSAFQSIMRSQTQDREPTSVSIATRGFELTENDLQFIYSTNSNIDVIYWLRTQVSDATIVSIEPEY